MLLGKIFYANLNGVLFQLTDPASGRPQLAGSAGVSGLLDLVVPGLARRSRQVGAKYFLKLTLANALAFL